MLPDLSRFGKKFTAASGIVDLMEDLGSALLSNPDMLMLGGGTPARIGMVEAIYSRHLRALVADDQSHYHLLGRYQSPAGDEAVRDQLAGLLNAEYGWPLDRHNIAITNGGQSAFSILANLLAGPMEDGSHKRVHFPLVPEYLGYADVGFSENFFSATKPALSLLPERRFKYHIDFDALSAGEALGPATGALCLSRPTNPSGNILPLAELQQLDTLAARHAIPLIIDAAYGLPFPGLHFDDSAAYWSDNTILLLSLSKLGLPGLRSGFVVGSPELIEAFSRANTILNLASGNAGPLFAASLMESGDLLKIPREILCPWYERKLESAQAAILQALEQVPCHLHVTDGACFLWLWFPELPLSTTELYQQLKQEGVLVIPGDTAFPGLEEDWLHSRQCMRLSYAVEDDVMARAAEILGRVLRRLHGV